MCLFASENINYEENQKKKKIAFNKIKLCSCFLFEKVKKELCK